MFNLIVYFKYSNSRKIYNMAPPSFKHNIYYVFYLTLINCQFKMHLYALIRSQIMIRTKPVCAHVRVIRYEDMIQIHGVIFG